MITDVAGLLSMRVTCSSAVQYLYPMAYCLEYNIMQSLHKLIVVQFLDNLSWDHVRQGAQNQFGLATPRHF